MYEVEQIGVLKFSRPQNHLIWFCIIMLFVGFGYLYYNQLVNKDEKPPEKNKNTTSKPSKPN